MRLALAVLLVALLPVQDRPLTISAAISLSGALEEIAHAYKASGGGHVRFNFAASNVLARQIVNGAPADLFISADEAQMDYAQKHSAIDVSSRVSLLANRLVIAVPAGRTTPLADVRALLRADVRRIAIGDPAGVPAGVYARQYLETLGLWNDLQPKLLPLVNVRAALAAVESGGADAGFVYATDAASNPRIRIAVTIDGSEAPRIVYPAAIPSRSRHKPAAAKFLAFLRSPAARTMFLRHGFSAAE